MIIDTLFSKKVKLKFKRCFLNLASILNLTDLSNLTTLTDEITENLEYIYTRHSKPTSEYVCYQKWIVMAVLIMGLERYLFQLLFFFFF